MKILLRIFDLSNMASALKSIEISPINFQIVRQLLFKKKRNLRNNLNALQTKNWYHKSLLHNY